MPGWVINNKFESDEELIFLSQPLNNRRFWGARRKNRIGNSRNYENKSVLIFSHTPLYVFDGILSMLDSLVGRQARSKRWRYSPLTVHRHNWVKIQILACGSTRYKNVINEYCKQPVSDSSKRAACVIGNDHWHPGSRNRGSRNSDLLCRPSLSTDSSGKAGIAIQRYRQREAN